jgi:hypothetical protein
MARQTGPHPAEGFSGNLDLAQNKSSLLGEQLSSFGGNDAAAMSDEEALPQFHFQKAGLPAQRWLGNVKRLGCGGKAAGFLDAQKIL